MYNTHEITSQKYNQKHKKQDKTSRQHYTTILFTIINIIIQTEEKTDQKANKPYLI